MSYINAERILPEYLVKELQNYVDGQIIYEYEASKNDKENGGVQNES